MIELIEAELQEDMVGGKGQGAAEAGHAARLQSDRDLPPGDVVCKSRMLW